MLLKEPIAHLVQLFHPSCGYALELSMSPPKYPGTHLQSSRVLLPMREIEWAGHCKQSVTLVAAGCGE